MSERRISNKNQVKKVLITGANSYVGTSFKKWVLQYSPNYVVDTIDMESIKWKEHSFDTYDSILHVAGIAHVSSAPQMESLYYKVNRDLAIEVAKKAKKERVKQFIFMSSIIVYGDSGNIGEQKIITQDTIPEPTNFYGQSKLEAEQGILELQDDKFKVVILRPPMIYGKGSKGNYQKLSKLARITPIFPDIENERSMLHIDNLCEFIRLMVENEENGLFYPQNREYVKTSEMVKMIAGVHGKRVWLTTIANPLLRLLGKKIKTVNKVFGNLVYDKSISKYKENYSVRNFSKSIRVTEKN